VSATATAARPVPQRPSVVIWRTALASAISLWAPALPLVVLAAALLFAPAVWLLAQSLAGADGFTLDHWARTFANRGDQLAIQTSIVLALVSASVSTLIGTPVAWLVSRMWTAHRAAWLALLNVAANFGGIGLGFAYLATLGGVGMLTLFLQSIGLAAEMPRPGSFFAVAIAYQYNNIPLFVLLTIPAMGILRHDLWEAAQTSAASRLQFWRHVGGPMLAPFVAAGWLLIFTWSIGIYGVAYALAGSGAGSEVRLITLQIGRALQTGAFGQERAAVLAVLLMAMAAVSLLAYRALLQRAVRWL
jgi:putative spermidine/putrescine transport system permease protein